MAVTARSVVLKVMNDNQNSLRVQKWQFFWRALKNQNDPVFIFFFTFQQFVRLASIDIPEWFHERDAGDKQKATIAKITMSVVARKERVCFILH